MPNEYYYLNHNNLLNHYNKKNFLLQYYIQKNEI